MILDVHTHICPPEIRKDREAFCEEEPDFRLLYQNPEARLIGAGELAAYLDQSGTDAACAFGFPWLRPETARLGNDYVLDAARRFPGRILPLACVNPLLGTAALREAERCLAAGARGLGEIATYGAGLGPEVREGLAPLAELCGEAGAPLLLHTNEPVGHAYPGKARMEPSEIYGLVKAHPRTTWILAHWGGGLFVYHLLRREADEVLRRVYYDTAAGPYLYKPHVYRRAADIAGSDRLLYGSDYPLLGLTRYRADLEAAGLTAGEVDAVLGGNAARLFRLRGGR
ncbi:MAG: amidohydrolase family protein [Deferrisomatales bacterium]|nr:amidohydrolase family protein [Deferrisomatales bacterium]